MLKNNFFFEWYYDQNRVLKKHLRWWVKFTISLIVIILLLTLFIFNNVTIYPNGLNVFKFYIKTLFNPTSVSSSYPTTSLWLLSWNFLLITLGNIFLGSIAGWLAGILTAYFLCFKIHKNYLCLLFNGFLLALRAFPVFVFIGIWQIGFDPFSTAIMIFFWFTWLWLHKYFINVFFGINLNQYNFYYKLGFKKFGLFYQYIYPQIKSKAFLFLISAIESNLRWVSILGSLGIVGIGKLIYDPIVGAQKNFNEILIPFVFLFFVLIIFEIMLIFFDKQEQINYVKKRKNFDLKKMAKTVYYLDKFKLGLFLFFFIIIIYSFTQITFIAPSNSNMLTYIKNLFFINETIFFTSNLNNNPFFLMLQIFQQTITILFWIIILGIFWGIFSSQKIVNKHFARFFIGWNLLMRSFPTILLFYLFNPIFNSAQSTVIIILTFHGSFSFAKRVNSILYSVSTVKLKEYLSLNYSRIWILINFIWPYIKKDIFNFSKFEFENILRDVVVMGVFGASLFGQKFEAFATRNPQSFTTYVWSFWIVIILINILINISYKKHWLTFVTVMKKNNIIFK